MPNATDGQTDRPKHQSPEPESTGDVVRTDGSDRQTIGQGLTVIARGTPRPQPRPRFANGRVISTADANARVWIASVERAAAQAIVCVGGKDSLPYLYAHAPALSVEMQFRFPSNRGRNGRKQARTEGTPLVCAPDTDNLVKLVLDSLVRQGALAGDDSRVASIYAEKVYAPPDKAGVTVIVRGHDPSKAWRLWPAKASDGSSLGPTPPSWVEVG